MEIKKTPKNAKFACSDCNFKCYKYADWIRHTSTVKHKSRNDGTQMENMEIKQNANFVCTCGKKYFTYSGLWKHSKTCKFSDNITGETNELHELKGFMEYLMKENSEMKNMMMKVIENGTNNTTTHMNSHNKSFNLQFFLNETCKDAMNIMDFVDSINIQLSDLERVGELGYVEGISNIIIKNLKAMDIHKRPVHCTDKKRETMYVKDQDKWEKDEEQKTMHKVVRKVAYKNQNLIPEFKEAHPDCGKYHSKFSDQYNKIIVESMGGPGDDDWEKEEKIIKKISKEVMVDK